MNTIPAAKHKIYGICEWDVYLEDYGSPYFFCRSRQKVQNQIDAYVDYYYDGMNSTASPKFSHWGTGNGQPIFIIKQVDLN